MASEWKVTTLGDVAHFDSGHRNSQDAVAEGEYPFFTCSREILRHSEFDFDTEAVIMAGNNADARFHLQYFKGRFAARQRTYIFTPKNMSIDCRFMYFALHELQPLFAAQAQGTTTKFVTSRILRDAPLLLPALGEQQTIAQFLGALDDKIELNRLMHGTLSDMVRAQFKSWFVDFDPVRRGPAVPDEVRSLFPDTLVDSPVGLVPRGWEVADVSALASVSRESVDPRPHPDEKFDHYSLPAFDAGGMPSVAAGSSIKSSKLSVPPESVLVSKLNPHIPRVWWPQPPTSRRAIASTEFVVALHRANTARSYLYGLFTSAKFQAELASLVRGTSGSHQRVSVDDLLRLRVVVPPEKVVALFDAVAAPMLKQREVLVAKCETLAELRDTSLPKLISGEVRLGA